MPLIEGKGDEVILVFAIVLVGAWMSTHIREFLCWALSYWNTINGEDKKHRMHNKVNSKQTLVMSYMNIKDKNKSFGRNNIIENRLGFSHTHFTCFLALPWSTRSLWLSRPSNHQGEMQMALFMNSWTDLCFKLER